MRISDWSSDVCSSDLCYRNVERAHVSEHWKTYNNITVFANKTPKTTVFAAEDQCNRTSVIEICPQFLAFLINANYTHSSQERRVEKEYVSQCSSRWTPYPQKQNTN